MPDVEEHLSVHRVTESALGVGLGGECGAGEYSPPSPFLAGSALFFWCVCVCGFSFVKDIFIQKVSKLSVLSQELTVQQERETHGQVPPGRGRRGQVRMSRVAGRRSHQPHASRPERTLTRKELWLGGRKVRLGLEVLHYPLSLVGELGRTTPRLQNGFKTQPRRHA